ncbi:hypothetical protein CK203_024489 [Vitis vinifera]|uniref:DUF4283 domain-containing protein n=1 Tax=Vitis vinifera TaxID=29760 RepID=A0A438IUG6_VITVI|nr:hypothetical protein CK203_024489 [Vitis vinifera]
MRSGSRLFSSWSSYKPLLGEAVGLPLNFWNYEVFRKLGGTAVEGWWLWTRIQLTSLSSSGQALVGGVAMGVGNSVGARKGEVARQRRRMLGFTRGKQCGAIVSEDFDGKGKRAAEEVGFASEGMGLRGKGSGPKEYWVESSKGGSLKKGEPKGLWTVYRGLGQGIAQMGHNDCFMKVRAPTIQSSCEESRLVEAIVCAALWAEAGGKIRADEALLEEVSREKNEDFMASGLGGTRGAILVNEEGMADPLRIIEAGGGRGKFLSAWRRILRRRGKILGGIRSGKGLWSDPWCVAGDFNVVRFPIKSICPPKPTSDHFPILLDGGRSKEWSDAVQVENMWLKEEGSKKKCRVLEFGKVEVNKTLALSQVDFWDKMELSWPLSVQETQFKGLPFERLETVDAASLEEPFSKQEVLEALKGFCEDKAPKPD